MGIGWGTLGQSCTVLTSGREDEQEIKVWIIYSHLVHLFVKEEILEVASTVGIIGIKGILGIILL